MNPPELYPRPTIQSRPTAQGPSVHDDDLYIMLMNTVRVCFFVCQEYHHFVKNTIRDAGSTALYAIYQSKICQLKIVDLQKHS